MKSESDMEKWIYEVITNTIRFDNCMRYKIRESMNIRADLDNEGEIIYTKDLESFDMMYEELGSSTKLKIFKKIIKEEGVSTLKDFDNITRRLYEIRNIFAHHIFPKKSLKDKNKDPKEKFAELYTEHKRLSDELMKWFFKEVVKISGEAIY